MRLDFKFIVFLIFLVGSALYMLGHIYGGQDIVWQQKGQPRYQIDSGGQDEQIGGSNASYVDNQQNELSEQDNKINKNKTKEGQLVQDDIYILDVPFSPQAPLAEWDNPIFQDGCEEATVMMVMAWVSGEELTKNEARKKIADMAAWQKLYYGSYIDSSAEDTLERLIYKYYNYDKADLLSVGNAGDIIEQVEQNKVVIVPTNGQKLDNPYYTPPGPERHNLLIRGYDTINKEFIVNDPGTKRGEAYRYKKEILLNAIRDYPSGNHLPIEGEVKRMIVVWQ